MASDRSKLLEDLKQQAIESARIENWEPSLGRSKLEWQPTPKQIAIMRILKEQPMLTDAVLRFVQAKQAEIARATLAALYTPEELEQLRLSLEALK